MLDCCFVYLLLLPACATHAHAITLIATPTPGHACSLVVDAATSPATLRFLDHSQRKWVDMSEENKATPRDLDKEVRRREGGGGDGGAYGGVTGVCKAAMEVSAAKAAGGV